MQTHFGPGRISKDGFLGEDSRHIHDIIQEDQRILSSLGWTSERIADRLQFFIDEGKKGLEGKVSVGKCIVCVRWDRGMVPCPFNEPGLHPKIVATVFSPAQKREIRYSQLSVHLIRRHSFFGGKGSVFRLEPKTVLEITDIRFESNERKSG